jgi:hypothetical protein
VFRELTSQPIGLTDHVLAAAQGIVSALGYCRARDFGTKFGIGEIFWAAGVTGCVVGIASLYIMAAIYVRLGARAGHAPTRRQVVHVLAYGGVPTALSLGIWVLTALLAGEVTFVQAPKDVDDFIGVLLTAQFASYVLLLMWSVVLQVMGFSEILGTPNVRAFGLWVLGQLIAMLAVLFLYVLSAQLFAAA